MKDFIVVDILDEVAIGSEDVRARTAFDELQVFVEGLNVAGYRMKNVFYFSRQIEEAVALAGQAPFLTGTDVIEDRPGLGRQEQADVADTGIDHVGHGKIDKPEFPANGDGRERPVFIEFF